MRPHRRLRAIETSAGAWLFALAGAVSCAPARVATESELPSRRAPATLAGSPVIVESWPMPEIRVPTRREGVVDELHGVRVPDPYRWLEDGASPEVSAWIDAQNAERERVLGSVPERERLRARLGELFEIGSISVPALRRTKPGGLRLFYTRREGRQNQPVLYVRDGLDGQERTLFDPNAEDPGGTTALDWYEPSERGELVAYGTSRSGTEDSTLRIRDVAKIRDLPDRIERTRYASLSWAPDGTRFFYSRYPKPGSVPKDEEQYHRKLYEHRLGADPESDPLIFGQGLAPTDFPGCQLSPSGRFLLVSVSRGWNRSALYLRDLAQPDSAFQRITPEGEVKYGAVVRDDALYVLTNEGAPRYRIFRASPEAPAREHWKLLVPEHAEDVIASFEVVSRELLLSYLHVGASRLERFDTNGASRGAVELPSVGSSDGFSGLPDGAEAFYGFESFARAPEIRLLDLRTQKSRVWQAVESGIPADGYAVETFWARSRDGTRVPYRVVHARGADLASGRNPTLLYGYGGFNESMQPRFSRSSYAWLERGGVYVQATLRGGGEFGESWHRAGQLEHKQNTFDDFIAVAEDLIARGVTSRDRLAIHGRSNGGLLVAAAITQRPELFRAAVAGVPLTDMIRYPKFLIAKLWVPEYGSPEEPAAFRTLLAYSPYHRVKPGTAYPAVLVTTAESDTRVDPLHARKFVAALQHATSSGRPVLLRTERQAGHGAGMPVSKLVLEFTDLYAFLFSELSLGPGDGSGALAGDKR